MDSDQFKQFEELIVKSCDELLSLGKKIRPGSFESAEADCFCPIGAVLVDPQTQRLVKDGSRMVGGYAVDVSQKLGFELTSSEMWYFIGGFDNIEAATVSDPYNAQFYQLGQKLRAKYSPQGM